MTAQPTAPVTAYEQTQWSRFATAAYAANLNAIGHRYSAAAAMPSGTRLPLATYDRLMEGWRAWLVFNDFTRAAANIRNHG